MIASSFPIWLANGVLLLGVGVVLPLAAGGRYAWWLGAAAATLVAFLLPAGPVAGLLTLPWVCVCGGMLAVALRRARRLRNRRLGDGARIVALTFAAGASLALVQSRLGLQPLGVGEPILELTAVHFTYAGCAALVLATRAWEAASGGRLLWGRAAVLLTAAGPPVVAAGFLSRSSLAQAGGAVLVALGVCVTAALQLAEARGPSLPRAARLLLATSGVAAWAPMALAIDWAVGEHWAVPALSIAAMGWTHGVTNAIGFSLCGLAGRRAAGPPPASRPGGEDDRVGRAPALSDRPAQAPAAGRGA